MNHVSRIGIDLAKDVFELYGVDQHERPVLSRRVRRAQLRQVLAALPACMIVMEACGSAHYWARELAALGHRPKLVAAQRAARYRDGDKTDYRDAQALCEAGGRAQMRFVPQKQLWQQELQALHRGREQVKKQRNATANQLRGILAEFGVPIPKGIAHLRRHMPELLESPGDHWGETLQWMLSEQYQLFRELERRLKRYERKIGRLAQDSPVCRRLTKVEGVGPLVATAFVAGVGDGQEFHRARQVGAWLGLVPKELSSGERRWLGPITKRGDRYLRTLLIQGARGAVRVAGRKDDARHRWVQRLRRQKGFNKAAVALAHKNARTLWALLVNGTEYQPIG